VGWGLKHYAVYIAKLVYCSLLWFTVVYCGYQTTDYDKIYEAKLTKTLKKFTSKPITQVCLHAGTHTEH